MIGITNTEDESTFKEKWFKRELEYYSRLKITWEKNGEILTAEGNKPEDFVGIKDGDRYKIQTYVLSSKGIENEDMLHFIYNDWIGDDDFFKKLKHLLETELEYIDYLVGDNMLRMNERTVDFHWYLAFMFGKQWEFSYVDHKFKPRSF